MVAFGLPRLCLVLCACFHLSTLAANSTSIAPIAFNPDENWDGIDGSWSSFTLRVGTPAQIIRVFASWMSYQTWVIHPDGCTEASDYGTCADARGDIFYMNASSTWDYVGLYSLWIEENLGYDGDAYYGYDVVGLGGIGEEGPTLQNTTVGDLAVDDFYLGMFGLNPKPTNWTSFEDSAPSYMTQLKEQSLIPSVSFGYTAGAPYRFTGVLASLTLGGFDQSRFESNDVEFTFAADNERDTVVAIRSITSGASSLLTSSIYALVDASVSQIWLPLAACELFEKAFGLVYDPTTELYLVDSVLHTGLLARNASVTFTLAQGTTSGSTVNITLPYAAFDLTASPPYQGLENSTTYFPLRRAANESQYTLGRTFFQEAYISVDYERAKFNISQCSWQQNADADIITIDGTASGNGTNYSGNTATASSTSTPSLSGGDIAGIAIGAVALVAIVTLVSLWLLRRKRQHARALAATKIDTGSTSGDSQTLAGSGEVGSSVIPKAELEGTNGFWYAKTHNSPASGSPNSPSSYGYSTYNSSTGTYVLSPLTATTKAASEADGLEVFEMPGDMPQVAQADGKEIGEKDMMRRRQEMYNGVDPNRPPQSDGDGVEDQKRQRRTVAADEIREARGNEGVVHDGRRFSFERDDDPKV